MKTSTYYKQNPAARKRRLKQQGDYNKTKKGLKIRTAANKLNRSLVRTEMETVKMPHTLDLIKVKQRQHLLIAVVQE